MKAIILSAGLGTRLNHLTKSLPKCLIKLNNKTILETQIEMLKKCNINRIILVIGQDGECWTDENKEKIKTINPNTIINHENTKTKNTHSLKLALEKCNEEDLLIFDGDLVFSQDLINKFIDSKDNLILTKITEKDIPGNKVTLREDKSVEKLERDPEKIQKQMIFYGGMLKINKQDSNLLKNTIIQNKYYNLDIGFLINDLCEKINIFPFSNNQWFNVNAKNDLEDAKNLLKRRIVILMSGYTGVGKSTISKKIAQEIKAEIFHSAVIRKELNLSPKNPEEADKFFNYKNNLRQDIDKIVYKKLAENARNSIKNKDSVILDAGFFFNWQREEIYNIVRDYNPEIFIVKVVCKNEEEIKKIKK